ncbi:32267_t:CDS:2 [Gigaspora margarita]|uniref:32267_t:CDS:1 n=1 Tax=Gigaspora margarita TaxID=4874 RepID=A0ABN7V3R5_GIGMA|nr:32267_t:CDS:2 [Gigaspora margarita]
MNEDKISSTCSSDDVLFELSLGLLEGVGFEAHNSNISKNVISKRKREPELPQENTNKHSSTLTKIIIQNSKCSKKDASIISQQNTKGTISLLKDKQPLTLPKQKDIYSSQWAFNRDKTEDPESP